MQSLIVLQGLTRPMFYLTIGANLIDILDIMNELVSAQHLQESI